MEKPIDQLTDSDLAGADSLYPFIQPGSSHNCTGSRVSMYPEHSKKEEPITFVKLNGDTVTLSGEEAVKLGFVERVSLMVDRKVLEHITTDTYMLLIPKDKISETLSAGFGCSIRNKPRHKVTVLGAAGDSLPNVEFIDIGK